MRLNPDCIRDILLTVEEKSTFNNWVWYSEKNSFPILDKYDSETVLYHMRQCDLSGLFYKTNWIKDSSCIIHDLSPAGHEFISNIRSEENWSKTKEIANKVGAASINIFIEIASKVITELISKQMGL